MKKQKIVNHSKVIKVPEVKISFTNEVFDRLTDNYNNQIKNKLNMLNNITKKILDEVEFIKDFRSENYDNIQIENSIDLNNNSSIFCFRKTKEDQAAVLLQFSVKNIEESEDNIFFDLLIYRDDGNLVYSEKISFEGFRKVIAIVFYLLLIEKKSIDSITKGMIEKIIAENT